MDWRVRIPGWLYRRAVERAGSDLELARLVRDYLTHYADETLPGQVGGRARWADRSDDERRTHAQQMAAARWARDRPSQ
jgi:hypothetical protein